MPQEPTYAQLVQRLKELEKDVAGRHREIKRLLESEQTYRSLFENAEILSSIYDEHGVCLLMNRKVASLFGGIPEALIGKSFDDLHPDSAGEYKQRVARAIASGETRSYEDRVNFPGGQRWLLSTVHPIADRSGSARLCQILSIDITDRRRTEDRLTLFKTAVAHSSDAIGISTPQGRHWYQNESFDRLFGDIGDDPPASLYVDEAVGREVFKTIMAGHQWAGEVKMIGRNGKVLNILLRAYAIKDRDGQVLGLVGTHTDITERKRAEMVLREREERLRTLLLANPDPMVMYDVDGIPQYLNPAFTEVFGWTLDELKGRRIPFVPDDQKETTARQIETVYASRATTRFETRRLTKDGRTLDVIVSAAVIRDAQGDPAGMSVNLTDITERKSLQAQYEQAQRMESLGTLAGGIAHDFNNLLMGIQGRTTLMAMDLQKAHPFHEHVREIEEYVKSASELTRQLLGFARGGKYEVKPLDVNELVQASAEMFARTKKELRVHIEMGASIRTVEVDRRQIEQVLLNIYVNAWQAMPQGGDIHISTGNIDLDATFCSPHQVSPGAYVSIAIADNGIGMDAAVVGRIFDPFFTTKEKSRGTGLGLASAFGIIKNHHGIITVDSLKGQGATFRIFLPASSKVVTPTPRGTRSMATGAETILLVDDETLILGVGRAMLEKLGYQIITAGSGDEALRILETAKRVDLVILDLIMPGMDGGQTFDHIRKIDPTMRVLLSSGYALDGQAATVLNKGCRGFIQKPFTIHELSGKIRSILDAADPPDP
jgi:PAS domain S-box-containing protein